MTPGTVFGLALIGAGILVFLIARPLTDAAAHSQSYLRPTLDKEAWKRRNVRGARVIGGAWMVIGAAIAIFGLVTGR